MRRLWYYHPESDSIFKSEPTEGDGLLVELGPVRVGDRRELEQRVAAARCPSLDLSMCTIDLT